MRPESVAHDMNLRFLLRANVGAGEFDPGRPHAAAAAVAAVEVPVVDAHHLQVAPQTDVAILSLEGRVFWRKSSFNFNCLMLTLLSKFLCFS